MRWTTSSPQSAQNPLLTPGSWQVAYTWAFIVKFGLRDKIKGLEAPEE